MKKYLLFASLILFSGPLYAQTNTPTNTPTRTPTSTPTSTNTPTRLPIENTTDFSAWRRISFKADITGSGNIDSFTVVVPGLKMGDLITINPDPTQATICSTSVLTNNTARVVCISGTDYAVADFELLWFARTQDNCSAAPQCQRAPTATPTP